MLVLLCVATHLSRTARLRKIESILTGVAIFVCVLGAVKCDLSKMVNIGGV
jgi:hypothetical protein